MSTTVQSRLVRRVVMILAVGVGGWIGAHFFREDSAEVKSAVKPSSPAKSEGHADAPPRATAEPSAVERENERVAALVARLKKNPAEALAEAMREPDAAVRRRRVREALERWAALDPDAAARAIYAWPADLRGEMMAAVLAGAAARPNDAVRLGIFFCRQEPSFAPEHGRAVIAALAAANQFPTAVSFALVGVAEVDGEERNKWLLTAFDGWAQREPQLAALAATDLPDVGMRHEALQVAVAAWRKLSPEGPERFLAQMPAGPERTALAAGLAAMPTR